MNLCVFQNYYLGDSGLLNVSVEVNESKGHSRSFSDGSSGKSFVAVTTS